jgi:hypothetical protein
MRYATSQFGETATVVGSGFVSGRTLAQMLVAVYDLTNLTDVTPGSPDDQCPEIGSTGDYYWKTSNLAIQPTAMTELLVTIEDQVNGQVHKTKIVLGEVTADAVKVSGDKDAADNIESTYDGTGYSDPYAPAQQQQLDQIALTGAAINTPPNDQSTVVTGTVVSGDYTEVAALDGIYWRIADDAGEIDMYFEFQIPADGVPVSFTLTGRINGNNDDLDVFAYDWAGTTWQQIGVLPGQATSADGVWSYTLFTSHVGTGVNLGKVRVRFQAVGLTSANFYTDQAYLSYAVITRSVGYADGAIWVDTVNGAAGTTSYINGTADNPVDSWADALTLSSQIGIRRFRVAGGSSIQLSANSDQFQIIGAEYDLDLNGQSIAAAFIQGATVTGISAGLDARFIGCKIDTVSLTQCAMGSCAIRDVVTLLSAGTYIWDGCFSAIAGVATPCVDFGAAVGDTNLNIRHYSGGIEVENIGQSGTDKMSLEGEGQIILNANCAGGTIAIRGEFPVTDNAGGVVTLSDDARITRSELKDDVQEVFIAQGYTSARAEMIETINKMQFNRLELSEAGIWTLYDDDSVTPLKTFTVTDVSGGPIGLPVGAPARRTRGT